MAPWLHDLLGYPHQGLGFERVFWALVVAMGVALGVSERRSSRTAAQNPLAWFLTAGLCLGGAMALVRAWSGHLTFGERGLMVPTYGVAMALGFGLPLLLARRDLRHTPAAISRDDCLDLGFWIIVTGLAGARLLAWFNTLRAEGGVCFDGDMQECLSLFAIWRGGLVFYGGVAGALIGGVVWCVRRKVSFRAAADFVVPYLALGHAIGRLGCVAAGCCYGADCGVEFPLGVPLPHGLGAWDGHSGVEEPALVHPVQLYEVAVELTLFAGLRWVRPRLRVGRTAATWLMVYAVARGILEIFRGDSVRGLYVGWTNAGITELLRLPEGTPLLLSTSQVFAMAMFALGLLLWGIAPTRESSPSRRDVDAQCGPANAD